MGFLAALGGRTLAAPIDALGTAIDKIFTSDEERMQAKAVLDKISQQPDILNAEINKVEASHRSLWVAGWRPLIGWIGGIILLFQTVIMPLIEGFYGIKFPLMDASLIVDLLLGMLGLSSLRTAEKFGKHTK